MEDNGSDCNVYDTVVYSELNTVRRQPSSGNEYERFLYHRRDVTRIATTASRRDDDDECGDSGSGSSSQVAYETISPLSCAATAAAVDSDSSFEKANSLYETKDTTTPIPAPASWSALYRSRNQTTSTPNSAISRTQQKVAAAVEKDYDYDYDYYCSNADGSHRGGGMNAENIETAAAITSAASVTSDDWLDINEWESAAAAAAADDDDDDQIHRNRIAANVKKRRLRLAKLRKLKRKKNRSYQNQLKSFVDSKTRREKEERAKDDGGGCSVENFSEELCDDFDDTSSDENDYTLRKSQRSPTCTARTRANATEKNFMSSVQSQNIYEFVKKARKTMRKSWSSFNQQMRRSSVLTNTVGADPLRKDDTQSVGGGEDEDEGEGEAARLRWSASDVRTKTKFSNNRAVTSASGSVRWASFKTKLRPKYSTVSAANSSSVFYLNPEDLRFDGATVKANDKNDSADARAVQDASAVRRRRTTCVDLNPTKARPSSPPPPPPIIGVGVDKPNDRDRNEDGDGDYHHHRDNQSQNGISEGAFDLSQSRSHSPPSSSNSDLNLSLCSDLRLRFADEPLYQFYAESVAQLTTNASLLESYSNDSDGYEEIGSLTSRPSAMELITPSPNGHGQCRSLWCEVEEVKNSGFLETLSIGRQKLQEAKFEVITSEASYYKSLSVLDKIFVNDARLRDENLVCKNDWKVLFGNVAAVRKCSQALLSDLEKCWQEDIMLSGLSEVIFEHASKNFKIFVKYCSNQIYIDRTLKKLREESANFADLISKLEADPVCQSLSLHSFLMLPMQRITRMPLLVDAILSKLDPVDDQLDHKTFKTTLAKLNKIVKDCNENARKFERYEEMLLISRQLEFSRKDVKMFSVASSSRWLVRSGPLLHLNPPDAKLTITRKLTKNTIKLYFFLFNDILVIAKKKSEISYAVVDYCLRNVLQMCAVEETNSSTSASPFLANLYLPHRYLLLLTILENHEGKTVEMVLSCDSDSTRQRWLEASYSRLTSDNPEEKLYEEWDCPQVLTVHAYVANQPDELSLQNGDIVKVLKKTTDGWYHGERIRDGIIGWFPGNYTVEIASQHTRAKNLKLRHRLLTLSADYLQNQQQK